MKIDKKLVSILIIAILIAGGAIAAAIYATNNNQKENVEVRPVVQEIITPAEVPTSVYPSEPKVITPKAAPWQPPAKTPENS